MTSIKKLLRPFYNSSLAIRIGNFTRLRTVIFKDIPYNNSASDLFFWKTHQGFETIFRATDIGRHYFDKDSILKLIFFDNKGSELKSFDFNFSSKVIEFHITKEIMQIESFGSFVALNLLNENVEEEIKITNRCYVGYSRNHDEPSFVHGNVISRHVKQNNPKQESVNLLSNFWSHKSNTTYLLQKDFKYFEENEFVFINPLNRKIEIALNGCQYYLSPMETKIISAKGDSLYSIKSNFGFPRPLVFSYKNNFFDVHHS
jgi:hypothetical protein